MLPQLSFAQLAAQLPYGPDILVVPAMSDVSSPENVLVLDWLKQQGNGHAILFSWCEGAEVLAAAGLVDGERVTTHWASIGRYERMYPSVDWQRGERYIDAGRLLTTAGLTSGIDATLHLLEQRNGSDVAAKVAGALHIPPSDFVRNPHMAQYALELSDSIMILNLAFGCPKPATGVWLYDGVGELDLTAAIDVYESTDHLYTVSDVASVRSRHGLQFVPRWNVQRLPSMDRLLVPGGMGATQAAAHLPPELQGVAVTLLQNNAAAFPIHVALEDFAQQRDIATARFAAKRLEVRSPLNLTGQHWPIRSLLMLLLTGLTGMFALSGLAWLLRDAVACRCCLGRFRHALSRRC